MQRLGILARPLPRLPRDCFQCVNLGKLLILPLAEVVEARLLPLFTDGFQVECDKRLRHTEFSGNGVLCVATQVECGHLQAAIRNLQCLGLFEWHYETAWLLM